MIASCLDVCHENIDPMNLFSKDVLLTWISSSCLCRRLQYFAMYAMLKLVANMPCFNTAAVNLFLSTCEPCHDLYVAPMKLWLWNYLKSAMLAIHPCLYFEFW